MGVNTGRTIREEQAIRQVTGRLTENFSDTYSPEQVEQAIGVARSRFEGRPVRAFVPILVERSVRRELDRTTAATRSTPPELTSNSGVRQKLDILRQSPFIRVALSRRNVGLASAFASVMVIALVIALREPATRTRPAPIGAPTAAAVTTARGAVGSEKAAFFEDPKVTAALAKHGLKVDITAAGSREIATSLDLSRYDFAFPGSAQSAERIQRQRGVTAKHTPFSSPMAIATFRPIVNLLAQAGVARQGPDQVWTFDVARYLELVRGDIHWSDLPNNTVYPVRKNILVSTTDPRRSNSAAMYVGVTGYVANQNTNVQGPAAEQFVLSTISRLFQRQGYTENSSEGPFREYLTGGMGPVPLAWIYEAQFVDAAAHGKTTPDMVLMYPSPTTLSRHTVVPLNQSGDRIGKLLTTDPELQQLAADHGFRPSDPATFAAVARAHQVPVAPQLVDVVDNPAYDTVERLIDGLHIG